MFDTAYQAALAQEPSSIRTEAGIALGRYCAAAILANRAYDGADEAQVPYTPGNRPGDYQLTPPFDDSNNPMYGFVLAPLWGNVRPFVLTTASQFRSPSPYELTSPAYAADVNEVKVRGAMFGSNRTEEESQIALFWRENSPLAWNRIARTVSLGRGYDGWALARLFALLQL